MNNWHHKSNNLQWQTVKENTWQLGKPSRNLKPVKLGKNTILLLDFIGKILVHTLAFLAQLYSQIFRIWCAEVAQLAEHSPEKAGVRSSILRLGTTLLPYRREFLPPPVII